MNYNKKTVTDIDVKGKKVLCRCDFNVPQDKKTGAITDDKRIRAALPTLQYLLDQGAAVIACSHLGKPKGEVKPELSLAPVAKRLEELLGKSVIFASDVVLKQIESGGCPPGARGTRRGGPRRRSAAPWPADKYRPAGCCRTECS